MPPRRLASRDEPERERCDGRDVLDGLDVRDALDEPLMPGGDDELELPDMPLSSLWECWLFESGFLLRSAIRLPSMKAEACVAPKRGRTALVGRARGWQRMCHGRAPTRAPRHPVALTCRLHASTFTSPRASRLAEAAGAAFPELSRTGLPYMRPLLRPPMLGAGARVALLAPAGPLARGDLPRAEENARSLGWEPVVGDHVLDRDGYFAGEDDARLEDLNEAVRDDAVDGIWFLRGGYGAMRLLGEFDFAALRRRPKALLGYSDITALHAAVGRHCGLVTYHAPTARSRLPAMSRASLEAAVVRHADSLGNAVGGRTLRNGIARGRLAGGNLTLLAALVGTPYMPDFTNAILVLEDVNEAVYRIDRMLQQLLLAGALAGVRGIAAGCFTNSDEAEEPGGGRRALDEVLTETALTLGVPCIAGIPMGHIDDQWTVPLGCVAELDAEERQVHVLEGVLA